jgi:cytidylate kinase
MKKETTMNLTASSDRLGEGLLRAQLHWQTRRQPEAENGNPVTAGPDAFTIAISREAGAQGGAVAAKLGERLGWPVYDQELLRHIAEEMGLSDHLLESVDEKRVNWLMSYLQAFASNNSVSEGAYLYHLSKVVLSLAANGECVIVGRGVAQFLPPEKTLRVRLVAPLDDRIAVMQKRVGLQHEQAVRRVESTDLDRTNFVREHFHKDPADSTLYDLILNTSRFTVEECAEIIQQAVRRFQARKSTETLKDGAG